ncbi:RNA-binding protein 28-like [Colias croceus]|uniref:RNA-binding protein 28-like n=1 Tax=Colias crocea TaxID=72248 RepID=UPI001E27A120|nr:RNA-binding protein 28-like [Colias croceus]
MPEEGNMDSEANTKYKDGVNRNARLIVRNISFKSTEESLKEHFSKYGTVEEVKLLKKPDGRLVGCAFVHFTHVPMANKALVETHKKPFLGRPIYVSWAVQKDKYTGELPNREPNLKTVSFSSDDEEGTPRVKEEQNGEVRKAKREEKVKKEEKQVRINRNARLIIRNVSFKATEETLKEHFEPYGTIQEVKLLKKPDGKLVGCAFVHFKNVPMAKKALLNTNMKPFLGRPISVDWAVAKDKYMQHVVNQQIEMEDQVKKEDDSDYDDDQPPLNISSEDVKEEVKSESDSDNSDNESDDEKPEVDSDEDESDEDGEEDEEDDEDEDDDDEDEAEDDDKSVTSTQPERQRIKLNDAEDGCTVFLTNVPFSIDNEQLQAFAEKTGPVKYALVCVDKLTEHSKGSAFIKFVNKEDADRFLALPPSELRLDGQVMMVKPALKRENVLKDKKQPKDNRNLYLVKEGVVVAGTKAALGVSASDMAKRLALERSKTQMLKNLNRFVSRYRLVVSNLTPNYTDDTLRRLCRRFASKGAVITEARVMRDLRAPLQKDGKHPSKGYGFVMFTRHEDALACLRKLNNNPDVFDKNNRPIVSFSIEDRTALNARKKRLEKSIANNPLANKDTEDGAGKGKGKNRKRKRPAIPDESYAKKTRFDKKPQETVGKFVKRPDNDQIDEYTGLTAKAGAPHKMRNNHKLRMQADVHRQNVKMEKKKSKRSWHLKMAARERVKQPKQKINKNKTGKRNKKRKFNDDFNY